MDHVITVKRSILMIFVLLLSTMHVAADIVTVTTTNNPSTVSQSASGQSQVVWNVTVSNTEGRQVTVQSPGGTFYLPDGTVLGQNSLPVVATRLTQIRTNTLFVFRENLTIPLAIIRAAQQQGFSRFTYVRVFRDSISSNNQLAVTNFSITGSTIASDLLIRRIQLEFDGGRSTEMIATGGQIQARAILSYKGTGLLEYSWEVASPPSTMAQPIFVPVASRKQFLLAGDIVNLQSPELNTELSGTYLVRLKIHSPQLEAQLPLIRYTVNRSGHTKMSSAQAEIRVSEPAPNAYLAEQTRFSWQAVPDATAYQVELFIRPVVEQLLVSSDEAPLTGVLVPANKTSITIGRLPRSHLQPGATYYWRVIALSNSGQIVGKSEFRAINY